jgi:membrane fusion protein (multidrug efflux system)
MNEDPDDQSIAVAEPEEPRARHSSDGANNSDGANKEAQRNPPKPKRNRGPLFWIVVVILSAGAAIWLVHWIHRSLTFVETDDAYINGHIHQVSSRVPGVVDAVRVSENEPVKAGQVLVQLQPLEFEIALQKAQAALTQARAQETQAKARLDQATAQLGGADVDFVRNHRLSQKDARAVAQADVETSKVKADAMRAALEGANADLEAARANIAAQEAVVRDAERELSYVTVTAPTDGYIGNKNVEVGNRVQVGQALFAVVEPNYWIVANYKETQLKTVRPGQPVEITIDALGGRTFSGKVDSVSPASGAQFAMLPPDNATGNFTKVVQRVPVKIVFDPESIRGLENRIRPGLSTVVAVRVR